VHSQACNNLSLTIDDLLTKAASTPERDDTVVEREIEQSEDVAFVTAPTRADVRTSAWTDVPSYPPTYLSTVQEHIPSPSIVKHPAEAHIQDMGDNKDWISELFETSLNVDPVFDRFSRRVGYEGQQCIRYVDVVLSDVAFI
jgi:pre-rRNA-processing protein TSR4